MNNGSDLQRFVDLYKSFGIELTPEYLPAMQYNNITTVPLYYIGLNDTNGFGGYIGFYSEVTFDENGKFIRQEFFEN